jgi:hypothetical protein
MHHHAMFPDSVFPDFSAFQINLPAPTGSAKAGQAAPFPAEDWGLFWPDSVCAGTSGFPAAGESAAAAGV